MAHDAGDSVTGRMCLQQNKRERESVCVCVAKFNRNYHTLLKHAKTLGTPSLGPSMPGMKSILGPIQLKGLTIVKSRPFSAPSAAFNKKSQKYTLHKPIEK